MDVVVGEDRADPEVFGGIAVFSLSAFTFLSVELAVLVGGFASQLVSGESDASPDPDGSDVPEEIAPDIGQVVRAGCLEDVVVDESSRRCPHS